MGARQSKRSVDISNPPKKGEIESGVEAEGCKLERLEEGDVATVKTTLNGTAPHAEKEATSPVTEEAQPMVNGDATATEVVADKVEEVEVKTDKEESAANGTSETPQSKTSEETVTTPESDDKKKKKEKSKKKWSFRSLSFSKKDKSKPNKTKDESKNGNVTKEEPVAEVVEAEATATTEALPIPSEEPKKAEAAETSEEEKKEKVEPVSTEVKSPEVKSPEVAAPTPSPLPETVPAPEPVTTPTPAPETPKVEEPPAPTPAPEPVVETKPEPVPQEEVKSEEMPPPLPASPPPTEAPPPTPVVPTPAPVDLIPEVILHVEPDTQEPEVVGGGGESMAEPEDVEPVLDTEEKVEEVTPMVNGISEHNHQFVEEFNEKVEIVTDNLKTIVTESIISTQVTENSEDMSEQTASAAE